MTDPLDAQERATEIVCQFTNWRSPSYSDLHKFAAEQIRQAEKAARKKALEEAACAIDKARVENKTQDRAKVYKPYEVMQGFQLSAQIIRALSEET